MLAGTGGYHQVRQVQAGWKLGVERQGWGWAVAIRCGGCRQVRQDAGSGLRDGEQAAGHGQQAGLCRPHR